MLTDLDDDNFEVRERAEQALARFGDLAEPALRAALEAKPSAEVRQRVKGLLDRVSEKSLLLPPLTVEKLRAVRVLEQIATPEAKSVLKQVAETGEDSALQAEASAALKRHQ